MYRDRRLVTLRRRDLLSGMAALVGLGALPPGSAHAAAGGLRGNGRLPVNPFLGADGEGHVFPGAQVPFGFAQVGPDMVGAAQHGYKSDAPLLGFSQTKASGTGGGMWGNLRLTPYTGEVVAPRPSGPLVDQQAQPGWFRGVLPGEGIQAELTADRMAGHVRFAYPNGRPAHLHLDVTSAIDFGTSASWQQRPQRAEIHCVGDDRVEGLVEFVGGWNGGRYVLYFALATDVAFIATTTWAGTTASSGGRTLTIGAGSPAGVTLSFPSGVRVAVRTGMSLISVERARRHRDRTPPQRFETTRAEAVSRWRHALATLDADGGTDVQRLILGSALRNVHIGVKDITGEDPTGAAGIPHYTDYFAIWDTFRTVHPLLTLIQPQRQRDMLNSVIATSRRIGWTFDALLAHSPGLTQGGTNADVLIADAYVKGLEGVDYGGALEIMMRDAEVQSPEPMLYGRETVDYIDHGGWMPVDYTGSLPVTHGGHGRVVSRTLEYNYDDFCIAAIADGLHRRDEAQRLRDRSLGWRQLWDPATRSVRPRLSDGSFVAPFDPWWPAPWDSVRTNGAWNFGWFQTPYYEGSARNYSTFVPHDTATLVASCGGPAGFTNWLDQLFARPASVGGFDPGNEPAFLAPWLYAYAGRPDRTADRVRRLLDTAFRPVPDGWPGNDDSGAMSALYIFSSLGIFPNAGQDHYFLGSPVFPEAELDTGARRLRIVADDTSTTNRYVQSVTVDGRPLSRAWITHRELTRARVLRFRMGPAPTSWGTTDPPPSVRT